MGLARSDLRSGGNSGSAQVGVRVRVKVKVRIKVRVRDPPLVEGRYLLQEAGDMRSVSTSMLQVYSVITTFGKGKH